MLAKELFECVCGGRLKKFECKGWPKKERKTKDCN